MALRLPWPLPALLTWAAAWLVFAGLQRMLPAALALLLASAVGTAASLLGRGWWRRSLIAAGFPLSLLATGASGLPGWAWLVPLALLLLVYPLNAWRDAPLFPTPRQALDGLADVAPLAAQTTQTLSALRVLDAGCGLGDGLVALRPRPVDLQLLRSLGLDLAGALVVVACVWAVMGLGGALNASFIGYISPEDFMPILTFQIWSMLIVGGSGNNKGAVLGAVLMWAVWTLSGSAAQVLLPATMQVKGGATQIILIGLVLMLVLVLRPRGLIGEEATVSQGAHVETGGGKP